MAFIKDYWPAVLITALILALLAISFVGLESNRRVYQEACEKQGGTTVYDGLQYQCFKT